MICSKGLAMTQYFCHKDQSELVLWLWETSQTGLTLTKEAGRFRMFQLQFQSRHFLAMMAPCSTQTPPRTGYVGQPSAEHLRLAMMAPRAMQTPPFTAYFWHLSTEHFLRLAMMAPSPCAMQTPPCNAYFGQPSAEHCLRLAI